MKGLIRGAAGLAVLLATSSCANDATIDLMGPPTRITASPLSAFISAGDSVAILVRLVNDRDQAIPTEFTVASVGPALIVSYDADYRPDYTQGDTLIAPKFKTQQRYFAKGAANGKSTFTLSSGGFSTTVTVVVQPKNLGLALNKTTGLTYGDTVTITAPAGLKFTPTSAVTFTTGPSSIASRSADSTSIKVVLGPGTGGVATVTNVLLDYAPTLALRTLATTNAVATTPTLTSIGAALSATTGLSAGSVVTITAPAGLVFSQTSAVSFPTGAIAIGSRSADSTSINVVIGPGTSGPATITKVGIVKAPNVGTFTVTTTNSIVLVPAVTVAPSTVSNLTPAIGVPITVTLGSSLRFLGTSKVFIGGREAGLQSVSADSSTATVMPMMGSSGTITYTNIALSFLASVALTVPGDKSITVGATYGGGSDANAGTIATASTIVLPPVGRSFIFSDAGPFTTSAPCATGPGSGDGCRLYKFVLTGAATYDLEFRWQGGSDLGLYRLDSTGGSASSQGGCDNGGQGAGGQPELCTVTALPAGTYFFAVAFYGTASGYPASANTVPPAFYQFRVSRR